jgi:DNA-binding transcriptional ArsR family regulator
MPDDNKDLVRMRAAEMASLMKTLSHPNRLLIACELMQGERSVSEIEVATGVRQPVLSRELARLRDEALVQTRRESKVVFYSIKDARLRQLMDVLCQTFGGKAVGMAPHGTEGRQASGLPQKAQQGGQPVPSIDGRRATRVRLNPDPYRKI